MAGEKIKVRINGLGQPTIEVEGGHGGSCKEITAGIEAALSGPGGPAAVVHKPEFFETEAPETEQEKAYY